MERINIIYNDESAQDWVESSKLKTITELCLMECSDVCESSTLLSKPRASKGRCDQTIMQRRNFPKTVGTLRHF
jgi:hypothetical protein